MTVTNEEKTHCATRARALAARFVAPMHQDFVTIELAAVLEEEREAARKLALQPLAFLDQAAIDGACGSTMSAGLTCIKHGDFMTGFAMVAVHAIVHAIEDALFPGAAKKADHEKTAPNAPPASARS
jgi:hypothetical protein